MAKKETGAAAARGSAETPVKHAAADAEFENPELYINRELSLLAFQRRVLEEAEDESNPLLERVKFLSILGSNLDEFFMVRVAGLAAQVEAGTMEVGPDGMSPRAQLIAIRRELKRLLNEARKCLDKLMPALAAEDILVLDYADLSETQLRRATKYFQETVFPVLTPLAFDPGRPFPHISNLEPEPGRDYPRPFRPGEVRAPQSARFPAATGAALPNHQAQGQARFEAEAH